MGILQTQTQTNDILNHENSPIINAAIRPTRPGALTHSSQRSMSYETSGTPRRVSDEAIKMSTRPSYISLTSSTTNSQLREMENNKENLMIEVRGHQRRTSTARRLSSRRTPSPTRLAEGDKVVSSSALHSSDGRSSQRRTSAENEKKQSSSNARGGQLRRSSDEATVPGVVTTASNASSRRNAVAEERQSRSPDYQKREVREVGEEGQAPLASLASSQYVTPGMSAGARVLRSGHAPKQASAPWSVSRSIKRMGESQSMFRERTHR